MEHLLSREILVAITFREFDDSYDAKIQEYWLQTLHRQTYKNFRLIVTNFNEQNTHRKLVESEVPFEFIQGPPCEFKFSFTETYFNTRRFCKAGESIVLWITADHILEDNFFEEIIKNFEPMCSGTSYPHLIHRKIENYDRNELWNEYLKKEITSGFEYDPNVFLPEVMYLDGDLLLDETNFKNLKDHWMDGPSPGIGFFYYTGYLGKIRQNLYFKSKIHKLSNDDTVEHFSHQSPSIEINEEIMWRYCHAVGIEEKYKEGTLFKLRKYVMHTDFKIVGNIFDILRYEIYKLKWFLFPRGEFLGLKIIKKIKRVMFNSEPLVRKLSK